MSEKNTVSRKSGSSTLTIGSVRTPVAIYKIIGEGSKARKWELANDEGEPWKAPLPGTATGEAPQMAVSGGGPLGETLGGPIPTEAEEQPDPAAESEGTKATKAEEPPRVFEDAQTVYLAGSADAYEVCGEEYVETPEYTGWTYDLQAFGGKADADDNKAGEITNGVQEGVIFPRSPVPRKGVRKADGKFVDLTDQIEEITERSTLEEMRIVSFIDVRHVPRERIISSYYLAGETGEGAPPVRLLATLMAAMRQKERVAVVRFSKRVGQTLGILTARRDGAIVLLEVAYAAQERGPNPTCLAAKQVEPRTGDVAGAIELIESMAGKRESLDSIRDPRLTMEMELIARAEAGELDELELGSTLVEDDEITQLGELLAAAAVA